MSQNILDTSSVPIYDTVSYLTFEKSVSQTCIGNSYLIIIIEFLIF